MPVEQASSAVVLSEPSAAELGLGAPAPVSQAPAQETPSERLARALESLNQALVDQRSAVTAWRKVLGDLKTTTAGLQSSLQSYQANLQRLGDSVSSVGAKARALEDWADRAVASAD